MYDHYCILVSKSTFWQAAHISQY